MKPRLSNSAVKAEIAAIAAAAIAPAEKVTRLLHVAQQLQSQAAPPPEILVHLYCQALELCQEDTYPLLQAKALVGLAEGLQAVSVQGAEALLEARLAYEKALPMLREHAAPGEIAAAEMGLGRVLQALAVFGLAQLTETVQAYQRALRIFAPAAYPKEHAVAQNNLAIAYLSMPPAASQDHQRQQLAMQAFEQALAAINLVDHPSEYAMLQNNLGNALQYLPGPLSPELSRRALLAYDEALKVRTVHAMPLEYAHTLANKANVLLHLPDDEQHPESGNRQNLHRAKALYEEAAAVFRQQGQARQAEGVTAVLAGITAELKQ